MCSCKWSGGKQTVDCLKRESHEIFFLFFSGDFIQSCPAMCSCKWSGGKQTVDCSSQSFTAIPTTLGQEVKVRIGGVPA